MSQHRLPVSQERPFRKSLSYLILWHEDTPYLDAEEPAAPHLRFAGACHSQLFVGSLPRRSPDSDRRRQRPTVGRRRPDRQLPRIGGATDPPASPPAVRETGVPGLSQGSRQAK